MKQTFKEAITMTARWKRALLITVASVTLVISYYAFCVMMQRGQQVKHQTPEQAYERWLKKVQEGEQRQPSPEEAEVVKMSLSMSYLTDKLVTSWLKQIDNNWYAPLSEIEPTWPRCFGGIGRFLELDPPQRREYIDEKLRPYVFVDGIKGELVTYPTPIPWSGGWGLNWQKDTPVNEYKKLSVSTEWFRHSEAIHWEWPTGNEASYYQVHGMRTALMIRYAIKRGSFSGLTVGDDSFFVYGMWSGRPDKPKYTELEPFNLMFRKYNFRCRMEITSPNIITSPATDEERTIMEKVARLVEAQIVAYSLFGLEKFTVLQMKRDGEEIYLPAGRISVGDYLVPVRYVIERVTGKRPLYDAKKRQMRAEVQGRKETVQGEVIEVANKYVQILEEERLVVNIASLRDLLRLQSIQDVRFRN